MPPAGEKPKAEPAGGHGPAPAAKPASPEEKTPPKPFVDVATEFDADRVPKIKTGGSVLIKDATILTVSHGTIARGSILVENGKITAVGPDVKAKPGMAVIEAAGLVAMPGIIDTHSHIAIQGGVNEFSLSIVPEVRVKDVVTGDDVSIYRALAGGTTTARLLHGSANTIGGQDAVIKLRYGKPGRELVIRDAPQGVKFALGENVTRSPGRFPNSRMGVESVIERAFEEGKAYLAEWKSYEQARKKDKAKAGPPPRRDLRLEALAGIVDGIDQDSQSLLPQRRDPDAPAHRRALRHQGPVAPARARGLQGRRRDQRARRQRLHVLGLVGLQGRGLRCHSVQRRPADQGRGQCLHQERQRGAEPPSQPRGRQDGEVWRSQRGPGAGDDHDQPRARARSRPSPGLDRGRQGRATSCSSTRIPSMPSRGASWL